MPNYFFDKNHIRYNLAVSHEGKPYNWIFLPGGPGGDSCYLQSLTDLLELPGNTWLVDFPGNGNNTENTPPDYDFDSWFDLLLPLIKKFDNPVLIGHSFGGMFPLLYPELEKLLKGFVILNSAPSLWLQEAVIYAKKFNLPDLSKEMQEFIQSPNNITFKVALEACMPYYFPQKTLEKGRQLLADVPFEFLPAVWWQRKAVELNFSAKWVPQNVPTLIVGGTYDCIAPFTLFQKDLRFKRPNIEMINIEDGGHCGWVENPEKFKSLFRKFTNSIAH